MTDFSDNSGTGLRLSNAERDRAVAALQSHAGDGRLTDAELQTRVQSARGAVTRGDLTPLFADLPGFVDFDGSGATAAPQSFSAPQQFAAAQQPAQRPAQPVAGGRGTRGYGRTGYIIVSIVPFVALILFFLTSWVWGYTYSWLWFLLVPIVGVIVYGGGYGDDRHRDRDRDRR
jgi:hypothetical protein